MIGTIRKHSKWLWFIIIIATIASFLFFFSPSQRMGNGGAVGNENFGSIYGKKVTRDAYLAAKREFYLFYFFHYGEWPDQMKPADLDREIYVQMMLAQKAADLGIYIGENAEATAAIEMLRSIGRNGQAVPESDFVKQVLTPRGLTAADFENFVRDDLTLQQLIQTTGLSGTLVTPQEATLIYEREHQEISAQIVFFSASNYLSQVKTTPEAVAQFYTNYLADYRLPDRVQVSYVEFDVTNYLARAKTELTNLDEIVDNFYREHGAEAFPDAKTPDEAKSKIREEALHQRAQKDALVQANEFATAVFGLNQDKPKPADLATVAKQKGLTVHNTAPFGSQFGPDEFAAPEGFTKDAFGLTPDEPFAGPIAGPNAVYVIALMRQLPTTIPPLKEISDRVTDDFQLHEATLLAQGAGTNFVIKLAVGNAVGKSFAAECIAAGLQPLALPPFSLATEKLPELGDHTNDLTQLKQAAFSTPVGHTSRFAETDDGGFVVHVQSHLPIDQSAMKSELPKFTAELRSQRESEAFNIWLQTEANRQLRDTPVYQQEAASGAAPAQ
ncbi:MAG TPA: SurA N-terminal domain-containing protein [Candidatus Paceibacterota bacterium]|nr:SurA N-terminal domain-containing protein [Candidatus Paceibacterota bacterium]